MVAKQAYTGKDYEIIIISYNILSIQHFYSQIDYMSKDLHK